MRSNINRRTLLATSAAAAIVTAMPLRAFALNEAQSVALIQDVSANVQRIINSGKSESRMLADFQNIFKNYGDVPRIAGTCLGVAWRTASNGQKRNYVAAFQGYISRKYGRQFRSFAGATISIIRSRDTGNRGVLVETSVDTPTSSPFVVEWHVIDAGGRPKFFDLRIEGISLITTERGEIGAMLEAVRGDVDQLTARLNSV